MRKAAAFTIISGNFCAIFFDSNTPEAAAPALYLLSGGLIPLPLTIMQILTIDIGTDMVPALGLGAEAPEKGVMEKPPRSSGERLLNKNVMLTGFLWYGFLATVFSLGGYFLANFLSGWPGMPLAGEGTDIYARATSMTLAGVVFSQIGMVMNNRTDNESVLRRGLFSNRYINAGIVIEILILAGGYVYTLPERNISYSPHFSAGVAVPDLHSLCGIWNRGTQKETSARIQEKKE